MSRTIQIGDTLTTVEFLIKYNSQCTPVVQFWENVEGTEPSVLTDVLSVNMEVYVDPLTTLFWEGQRDGNTVSFPLLPADTLVAWETRPFNMVFMKPLRNVVLSGIVQVQR
jgi:hypothetical protein